MPTPASPETKTKLRPAFIVTRVWEPVAPCPAARLPTSVSASVRAYECSWPVETMAPAAWHSLYAFQPTSSLLLPIWRSFWFLCQEHTDQSALFEASESRMKLTCSAESLPHVERSSL